MTSSDSPKLPIWVFAVTDAVLLGAAVFIAVGAPQPLPSSAMVAIVACVIAGALALLVPLIARYERQKNETLDERQRALEGLAATLTGAAEQIGIAAKGLHDISDLVHKNIRHAEQLPHKLQDKIAEFQSQLAAVSDAEKEELEKELVSLRSSESERLESTAAKIAKTAAELAKLEAATQQHLGAANDALTKLSMGTAAAIGKAQAAAEQALAQARTEAARGLGETAGNATRAIESAQSSALAELDAKLAAAATTLADRILRELSGKLPALSSSAAPPSAPAGNAHPAAPSGVDPEAVATASADVADTSTKPAATAQPPKRPRKTRREDSEEPAPAAAATPAEPAPALAEEPPPIPAAKIPEITPVAPDTAQPFPESITTPESPAAAPTAPASPPPPAAAAPGPATPAGTPEPARIPRRRSAKKTEGDADEPALDLGMAADAPAPNGTGETTLSSDGATRLLVTAYIGIGNRLFIRGTGPGLSWEKGVPLQFVSIGKWRWETNDASAPVEFKLYKNDDLECTALGAQSVAPGYQQEVTATF